MHEELENQIPTGLLEVGSTLDEKYIIEEVIGLGGMGAVYRALHIEIDRRVAIKRLHPHLSTAPGVIKRFQNEARAAGSIGHHNICEVTDRGTAADGTPYLVMPLLIGFSMRALLRNERVSFPRLADILCQTLLALEAAHEAQIVHRDLKPDNLFITQFGDHGDLVKLLDFGISKLLSGKNASELTHTGLAVGTPFYMAPEQARGAKWIDHRADLYALGVIFYQALTGRRPFDGESWNEVMFNIISNRFPAPTQIRTEIPPELENFILRAMARDADQRFESASAMREALEAIVPKCSVDLKTAVPPDVERPRGSDAATRPQWSALEEGESHAEPATARVTAIDESAFGFEGFTGVDAIEILDPAPPAERPRSRRLSYSLVVLFVLLTVGVVGWALINEPADPRGPGSIPVVEASSGESSATSRSISSTPTAPAIAPQEEMTPPAPLEQPVPVEAVDTPAAGDATPKAAQTKKPRKRRRKRPASNKNEFKGNKGTTFFVDY